MRFLSASLSKLATNLKSRGRPLDCVDCRDEIHCKKFGFPTRIHCESCATKDDMSDVFKRTHAFVVEKFGEEHFDLLTSKQVYPYRLGTLWGGTQGLGEPFGWDPGVGGPLEVEPGGWGPFGGGTLGVAALHHAYDICSLFPQLHGLLRKTG